MRSLALLLLAAPALWIDPHPRGAATIALRSGPADPEITEWTVPWEKTRPRDPYLDQKGRVWFTGQAGNYIAYLEPSTGEFKRFDLEARTNAHNVGVDRHGMVWYTGNMNGRLGRLDPATGKVTTFPMPDSSVRDPHTLVFDRKGDVWFTAQSGNVVGRLTVATGTIQLVRMPQKNSRPYGIVLDSKDRPWFDEFGTNKIGMIDPATMQLKEYPLPNDRTRPRRIAITSDDVIWYGDYTRGYLGRLDPKSGAVKEYANPGGGVSLPYGMTTDDRDRIWIAETGVQPNRLVVFDPKTESFVAARAKAVSGQPNTVRHMIFHKPSRTIWFGTDANTIVRVRVTD